MDRAPPCTVCVCGVIPRVPLTSLERVLGFVDLDTVSPRAAHRAEHLSRNAAAAAHASYYAHPSLHLHTYLSKEEPVAVDGQGQVIGALNDPIQPIAHEPHLGPIPPSTSISDQDSKTSPSKSGVSNFPHTSAQKNAETGPEGTKKEEGGKEDAGAPSGMDKGALEIGGEAGGTKTSPGPSIEDVKKYHETQNGWSNHAQNGHLGVPGQANGTQLQNGKPGLERHWSIRDRMEPHLQMMCGPLLAYYTVKNDVWQGAALVVVRDDGSDLSTLPSLALTFHPHSPPSHEVPTIHDPSQTLLPNQTIESRRIHTYASKDGNMSFFRFMIEIPLQQTQMTVRYRLNRGAEMDFVVPSIGENMRWAAHSCNGFSSGVNPDEFKGNYPSGYDPVWEDLLLKHHEKPFHCMVGGGDQIYCDALTRELEMQEWITAPNRKAKLETKLTDVIREAVDRFYFNHYCKIFRSNAFGRANSTIPMVNMLDDHDLIDGFGTYDDETQASPIMSFVGSRGYFWFLLFQLFVSDEIDGVNPIPGTHTLNSMIIGDKRGPWIPFPSHSLIVYLGPKVSLLALDCRAERKLDRICTTETYAKAFGEVRKVTGIEQLVILLGVPIAYPRMSFLEHFLDFKYNPINMLARHNAMGLGSMVNKFNQASELLDDLNDHWCANTHKKERNWLVLECQELAKEMQCRITFLSGDVHLAAVGCLFTYNKGKQRMKIRPEEDHRYMLNIITSAIVNTPPPPGAAKMVAFLGSNKHRTLPKDTDEIMIPLFEKDTDGSASKLKYVLNRRNYTAVEYNSAGELVFDIKVEKTQGGGETVSYPIKSPAPRW
ncbi:uncharacterized protein IL334_006384 [Kwoniella shivajii]|uniref:PhoD-like phosphatase domain-containing protein n=1 Tax=Kwoniella shivajii TaxID=564305 RepID=A0ABZ1D5T2_9TREE|nr:hypothetical protein IL334_006384 [Kwoniella shivajii]